VPARIGLDAKELSAMAVKKSTEIVRDNKGNGKLVVTTDHDRGIRETHVYKETIISDDHRGKLVKREELK
jgi:hypothetical protein